MKGTALFLFLAASVATAQSNGRPATASKAPQHHAAASTAAARAAASKLPAGIPAVHGIVKTAFALKYQDYKAGAGALAEPNKLYRVQYTGYLAATGQKFDSSYDHRAPVMSDGKPVMGADGKPQLGEAQPMVFPQGYGRLIPGFDQGFEGMHVGGKRRIFIPWELGYGMRSVPARGDSPGIPPKSDLIFDVELVDVTEMPAMPSRPAPMHAPAGAIPGHAIGAPHPGADASQPEKPSTAGAAGAEQKPATTESAPGNDTKAPPPEQK